MIRRRLSVCLLGDEALGQPPARWGPHPSSLAAPQASRAPRCQHTHSLPSSSMSSTSYLWVNKRKAGCRELCSRAGSRQEGEAAAGRGRSPGACCSHTIPADPRGKQLSPTLQTGTIGSPGGCGDRRAAPGLGIHSLVGGMAVTDHFGQDPLLIPVHGLHSGSHLISRFGHIVPRSWNGPTEGWGLVTRLPDPQGQGHG